MGRQALMVVVCSLLLILQSALLAQEAPAVYSHPPTYDDFVRSTAAIDLDLRRQLEFTDQDIATIQASDDLRALAGATASDFSSASRGCLWKALGKAPEEPRLWALACYSFWGERKWSLTRSQRIEGLEPLLQTDPALAATINDTSVDICLALIRRWEELDPDNLAALCVEASFHADRGDVEEVARCLGMFESRLRYESYGNSLRSDIVRAAETVGYCPLAARRLALGWAKPLGELLPLCKFLDQHPEFTNSRRFLASAISQAEPRLFSERMVISAFSDPKGFSESENELLSYIRTFRTGDLPESRWVIYFDEVFNSGEREAIERLRMERNGLPGTRDPGDETIIGL